MGLPLYSGPDVGRFKRPLYPARSSLFEFRIRKVGQDWLVLTNDTETSHSSFIAAAIEGERLKGLGYKDGDR